MTLEAFLAGVSFLQQIFSIAQAMGLDVGLVDVQTQQILDKFDEVNLSIQQLKRNMASEAAQIKNMIAMVVVVQEQARLRKVKNLPSNKLELLIKLLFCLKLKASNVVFAVVVKYKVGNKTATLGFAGNSSDCIGSTVMRIDSFLRSVSHVSSSKTAYTGIRIRGKYDPDIESFCTAILATITTDVCGFSRDVAVKDEYSCKLIARGKKTIVMLKSAEHHDIQEECDKLRRIFLVGDTRSGKSTLGNAFLKKKKFVTSEGMTGTMRIQRSERVEHLENEKVVTEIYDTPGLNDKDGLDIWYQSAIEDQIAILQRASAFIMTIAVDAGITESARRSLKSYTSLFGHSMTSMMFIVLTINKKATQRELKNYKELNVPHVLGLGRISKENIHCVSLYDLREREKSASHDVVQRIAKKSRDMPMKVIEAFEKKYKELGKALSRKSNDITKGVKKALDDGWQVYENVTDHFENRKCTAMEKEGDRMNGFVMSNSTKKNVAMKAITLGVVDRVRKVAVHMSPHGKKAKCAWQKFRKENRTKRHNSNLMRKFGDELYKSGLGVIVKDVPIRRYDILRVKSYEVAIFDPVGLAHEELAAYAHKMFQKGPQELKPELIDELTKKFIPCSIRCSRHRRLQQQK